MTTVSPNYGHTPLFTQQGVGSSPGYDAIDVRRGWVTAVQEGVIDAGSFEVVQRSVGANMSVDVNADVGLGAFVQGDVVAAQGLYHVAAHGSTMNEAITAAHATLPRIDQLVLEVLDNVHDASGSNLARVRVVAGTATAGATLDNRLGAASLPSSCMQLADVLVPATDTAISNSQIRDRRKWARGAYKRTVLTSGALTTSSATFVAMDATNLNHRIECVGNPVRMSVRGAFSHSSAGAAIVVGVAIDGATPTTRHQIILASASTNYSDVAVFTLLPAAGSHMLAPHWFASPATPATATVQASAAFGLEFEIEELVRQNTANNATTSG
jgi:hypothetical protein